MPETKKEPYDSANITLLRLMLENMALREEAARTRINAACPGALKQIADISQERRLWMESWNEAMIARVPAVPRKWERKKK